MTKAFRRSVFVGPLGAGAWPIHDERQREEREDRRIICGMGVFSIAVKDSGQS
jgi:hypothetical protein